MIVRPEITSPCKSLVASLADITSIVFQGLGDSISAFTKGSTTVTVNGVAYEFWRTNDLQGDVISGRTITVG